MLVLKQERTFACNLLFLCIMGEADRLKTQCDMGHVTQFLAWNYGKTNNIFFFYQKTNNKIENIISNQVTNFMHFHQNTYDIIL